DGGLRSSGSGAAGQQFSHPFCPPLANRRPVFFFLAVLRHHKPGNAQHALRECRPGAGTGASGRGRYRTLFDRPAGRFLRNSGDASADVQPDEKRPPAALYGRHHRNGQPARRTVRAGPAETAAEKQCRCRLPGVPRTAFPGPSGFWRRQDARGRLLGHCHRLPRPVFLMIPAYAKRILIVFVGAVAVAIFFSYDLQRFLTLDALKANRLNLLEYYVSHRVALIVGFLAVYIIQTALSLPGAAILSLAAGAIFGSIPGTLYAIIAATIGATLAFLVTRYLLRDAVLDRFGSRLEGMNRELEARGFNYLLFLRLVPVFPFF